MFAVLKRHDVDLSELELGPIINLGGESKVFTGSQLTVANTKNICMCIKNIGAIRWKHAAHAWTRHSGPTSLHGSLPSQQDAAARQTTHRWQKSLPNARTAPDRNSCLSRCCVVVAPSPASKRSVRTVWVMPTTSNLPNCSLICRVSSSSAATGDRKPLTVELGSARLPQETLEGRSSASCLPGLSSKEPDKVISCEE